MATFDTEHRALCHALFDAIEAGRWTCASWPTCANGMISRIYEYFDTGQVDKFLPPRGEA